MHVAGGALEFQYRIADQLPRPVIGDLTAARHAMNRHARRRRDHKMLGGAAPQRIDVRMLQQQQGIVNRARLARRRQFLLNSQRWPVINAPEPGAGYRTGTHIQKLIASPSAASAASMIASEMVGWGWTVRPNSRVVASSVLPSATSEIMSVAPCPMI